MSLIKPTMNIETDFISTTESLSSDHDHLYEENLDSFDELFAQLNQEIKLSKESSTKESGDEFSQIQKSIKSIPKLESNLDRLIDTYKQQPKDTNIKNINDSIPIKAKKKEITDSGDKWFNMPKGELTTENKRDLLIIQQRNAIDPKRHYKKDKWKLPEFFQMGTIIESKSEFYSSRLNNKQRGKNLVDEILNDDETKKYFKRKYTEIQDSKTSGKKAHYKKMKDMRKKF